MKIKSGQTGNIEMECVFCLSHMLLSRLTLRAAPEGLKAESFLIQMSGESKKDAEVGATQASLP